MERETQHAISRSLNCSGELKRSPFFLLEWSWERGKCLLPVPEEKKKKKKKNSQLLFYLPISLSPSPYFLYLQLKSRYAAELPMQRDRIILDRLVNGGRRWETQARDKRKGEKIKQSEGLAEVPRQVHSNGLLRLTDEVYWGRWTDRPRKCQTC